MLGMKEAKTEIIKLVNKYEMREKQNDENPVSFGKSFMAEREYMDETPDEQIQYPGCSADLPERVLSFPFAVFSYKSAV